MRRIGIAKIAFWVVLAISFLFMLRLYARCKHPFKAAAVAVICGLGTFLALHLTSNFTGIAMHCNVYTVSTTAVLGVPAVVGLLFLNLIFKV